MKTILLILICVFALVGCHHKRTPEEYDKEYSYYQICRYGHAQDADDGAKYCDKAFKKKFGHPFNVDAEALQ